jgi:hypothetical protein
LGRARVDGIRARIPSRVTEIGRSASVLGQDPATVAG